MLEGGIEHAQDIGAFIVHHDIALRIPQHRHGCASGKMRIGARVDLVHVARIEKRIVISAGKTTEPPPLIGQPRVHHGQVDHVFEALSLRAINVRDAQGQIRAT